MKRKNSKDTQKYKVTYKAQLLEPDTNTASAVVSKVIYH